MTRRLESTLGGTAPAGGGTVFQQQEQASQDPTAELFDAEAQDMAVAITHSLADDGSTTPSANLKMGGHKHTGVGDATANDEYATLGQIPTLTGTFFPSTEVGGTANAVVLTPSPAITAYTTGMLANFFAKANNTGNFTIGFNSLAAIPLLIGGVNQLPANNIVDPVS